MQCPICESANAAAFSFKRGGNSIYRCSVCNLEFLFPQPGDEALSAIYTSGYFLGAKDEESTRRQELLKRRTARLYLDALAPYVRAQNPRLLELGCGNGDLLLEAQSRGFTVEGLEYSEHAVRSANARLGCDAVRVGSPDSQELARERYDVIAAADVIEHLRDPLKALRNVYPALKAQGLLILVTPSLDSWSRRLLGRYWMEYKTEHLTYFSKRSLARILNLTGFDVIQFVPNYKILDLDYISAHFDRFPVPVVSSIVRFLRRMMPDRIAYRPIKVAPSGVLVIARKRIKT